MIIDAHAHLGSSWLAWSKDYLDLDGLIKLYDKYGIAKACISSWLIFYDPPKGNIEIFEAVKKYPDRLIGFAVVSPRYGKKDVIEEIDRCVNEYKMKGIKIHPSASGFYADSHIVDPVMEKAIEYDIPVLFHSWNDNYSNPRLIGNLAKRFPDAKIIMAHFGFEDWLEGIFVAKENKNVYLDTTGSPTEWLVIKTAVQECGGDKIVWGSDSPALNIAAELAKVTDAQISEEIKEKILYKNISKLLKL